jgi:hypothetical protein
MGLAITIGLLLGRRGPERMNEHGIHRQFRHGDRLRELMNPPCRTWLTGTHISICGLPA